MAAYTALVSSPSAQPAVVAAGGGRGRVHTVRDTELALFTTEHQLGGDDMEAETAAAAVLCCPCSSSGSTSTAKVVGGRCLSAQILLYGFEGNRGGRCSCCAVSMCSAVMVAVQMLIALVALVALVQDTLSGGDGKGAGTSGSQSSIKIVDERDGDGLFKIVDNAFGSLQIAVDTDCCDAEKRSWIESHNQYGCIASDCVGFFAANEEWASRYGTHTAWNSSGTGHAQWMNRGSTYRVASWNCGETVMGQTDTVWESNVHDQCLVELTSMRNHASQVLSVPKLCTPLYYCHKLSDYDGSTSTPESNDNSGVLIVGVYELIALVDRILVLRLAIALPSRLDATLGGFNIETGLRARVRRRISKTSRNICVVLWLPVLFVVAIAVIGAIAAMDLFSDSGNDSGFAIFAIFILMFEVISTAATIVLGLLSVFSLGCTAVMLWAECVVIHEQSEEILQSLLALPVADRDVDNAVQAFSKLREVVAEVSNQWSQVLLVQMLLFVTLCISVGFGGAGGGVAYFAGIGAASIVWPVALSFGAVVRINSRLDAVPARLTTCLILTSVERSAFADDYKRLELRLKVMGLQLTTERLTGVFFSAVLALGAAWLKSAGLSNQAGAD